MMKVILAIIIISLIVIEVCAEVSNSDAKKKVKGCKNPKALYGQTMTEDCSVMECSKSGKWESCGQPTRQDSLEKIEDSVENMKTNMENMKDTMENMKDIMENMVVVVEYGSRPWRVQGPQDIRGTIRSRVCSTSANLTEYRSMFCSTTWEVKRKVSSAS